MPTRGSGRSMRRRRGPRRGSSRCSARATSRARSGRSRSGSCRTNGCSATSSTRSPPTGYGTWESRSPLSSPAAGPPPRTPRSGWRWASSRCPRSPTRGRRPPPPSSTTRPTTSPRSSTRASGTSTPRSRGRTGSCGSRSAPGGTPPRRWKPGGWSPRPWTAAAGAGDASRSGGRPRSLTSTAGCLRRCSAGPSTGIRFIEPDVGGGFGARGEFYPEDFLVPCAALRLGRPVKWIEDRAEHLTAINHSREQRYELALALDAGGALPGAGGGGGQRHGRLPPHPRDGRAGPERGDAARALRDGGVPVPGPLRAHQQDPDRHLPRPPAASSATRRASGSSTAPPGCSGSTPSRSGGGT